MIHSCLFMLIRVAPQANNAGSDWGNACGATRICTNTHLMFQESFMIHSCLFMHIRVAPQAKELIALWQ
jgi:hypothetical protein